MPKRKREFKQSSRAVALKRSRKQKSSTKVYFSPRPTRPRLGFFKQKNHATVRYVSHCTITMANTGSPGTHVWSMNGLYDPDVTSTGHQPIGFDQYMQMYNHYTVIGARIKATFLSTTSNPKGMVYLFRSAGATVLTDRDRIGEQTTTVMKPINKHEVGNVVVQDSANLNKELGQKVIDEDNNAGTDNENPNEQVFWHLAASSFDGNAGSVVAVVEIDYDVIFHEPRDVAQS